VPDNRSTSPQIDCRNLQLSFAPGQPVLRDLSLVLPAGEITCLLGPSGCGKSTLLKCIAGLLPPDSGFIRFDDQPLATLAGRMSFVFQEPTLLPWRTVRSNVLLPLELQRRHKEPECLERVDRFLKIVGLHESDQRKFPSELSGGMKMRASLARALATDPDVLLLDEPFAALDDVLRNRLNELLLELVAQRSRTVAFVTHNIAEAVFLSQQIAIIGRGSVHQVWRNPLEVPRTRSSRSTAEFAALYGEVASAMESAAA
jgi:NitT/TauT family transport system ATP-binding protein